jgi:hypothetical protein
MATVLIAEMFGNVIKNLDAARNSLGEAAAWARSDWSDRRSLTDDEAESRLLVFEAVHQAKDAIDDAKGLIYWSQREPTSKRRRRVRTRSGVCVNG